MKNLIEISMKEGGTIFVETEPPTSNDTVVRVSKAGEIIDQTQVQLEAALAKMKPVTSAIIATLKEPINAPDEVAVEFGIKLNAEANVIISSTAVEGNFKVSLKWKKGGPERKP